MHHWKDSVIMRTHTVSLQLPHGKERYMSVDEIREVGRRFVEEVINKQNLAAADELVAENFVELTS